MTSMIGSGGYGPTGSLAVNMPYATGKTSVQKLGGYRHFKTPNFTPEQFQLFQRMFGQLGPEGFLSQLAGGSPEMFEQLEAPALRQFGELEGNIASRFSGMGMGARRSSGFQNTMSQASQDFAQQLQSQRLGLQRQAVQDLMQYSNQLLGQRPYEQFLQPKKSSFLSQMGLALTQILGKVAAAKAGGGGFGG